MTGDNNLNSVYMGKSDFFIMTKEREDELWRDSILVFDTNAILALYRMTANARDTMLEIFTYLKERIWIPAQVIYEYKKNRIEAINELFGSYYQDPKFFKIKREYKSSLKDYLKALEEKKNYHPYFEDKSLETFKKASDDIQDKLDEVEKLVRDEYNIRKSEIDGLKTKDSTQDLVITMNHGVPYSFADTMEIVKEGEWRYRNQLPPGYEDAPKKYGTQKYGDLIIWKEILKKAKDDGKPVIVITNDKKEDWYEAHDAKSEPTCPRHEMLREFMENTGKDVWFYTLDQFIHQLESRYKGSGLKFYEGLEEVRDVLRYAKIEREREEKIKKARLIRCECENCGQKFTIDSNEFDFYWDIVSSSEREMGPETEYECTELFECPDCGHDCEVHFRVWEYPVGIFNYQEIESEGCEMNEDDIDLSDHITFDDREPCEVCGEYDVLDEFGMCSTCAENKRRELMSED